MDVGGIEGLSRGGLELLERALEEFQFNWQEERLDVLPDWARLELT